MSEQHPSPEDSSTDLHGSGGGGALTGGAYKQEEERESTEEAAVETGISESIDHELNHTLGPQEPVSNNPSSIDNKDQPNQACTIEVLFSGPSVQNTQVGPAYTIGFSVKISGLSGDVAVRSTVQDPKPKGWLVEQWVADYNVRNGEVVRQDTAPRMDRLGRARPTREGDNVRWGDSPGTGTAGTQSYHTKRDFFIKAYNGDRYCEIGFHLSFRVFNGQIVSPQWDKGLYK